MSNLLPVAVYVGIGSNIEPRNRIPQALRLLEARFGGLRVSQTYECPAVGFDGDAFFNLVAGFETTESALDVVHGLREIEQQCGRNRSETMSSHCGTFSLRPRTTSSTDSARKSTRLNSSRRSNSYPL